MRIAGGEWRGRALKAPPGDVLRPTQDRVREALFSMLMHETPGARFLDLFAGVGGVGLEALSRGAADCTFVELAPRHLAFLRANVAALAAEARCHLVRADAYAWLETFEGAPFDVAFADPPYELGTARQTPEESSLWDLCRDRTYGQTRLAVYMRKRAQR